MTFAVPWQHYDDKPAGHGVLTTECCSALCGVPHKADEESANAMNAVPSFFLSEHQRPEFGQFRLRACVHSRAIMPQLPAVQANNG